MEAKQKSVALIILVATLGYFVDIYDLVIFTVVRVKSFTELGVGSDQMLKSTQFVLNMQMAGLLLGGLLWGYIGDKYGRIKVLFGSILLYSTANVINGFVQNVDSYAWIRFVAGIGLAGELGAGITLVSENMHRSKRGYGTMVVAVVGVLGAVFAFFVAQHLSWQYAYFVGGGMGFLLLLMRLGTFESGMFTKKQPAGISKGKFSMLFTNRKRFLRYLYVQLIGLPIWFVVGVFVALSPEFGKALQSTEPLSPANGVLYCYLGIALGDFLAGLLAQVIKSRLKTVFIFQVLILVSCSIFLSSTGITPAKFGFLAFFMGLGVGYWATFVTIATEQFGTNLRATVATTAPNFVRGALIPSTLLFNFFMEKQGILTAGFVMIFLLSGIAIFALTQLKESFDQDLDFVEE